MDKLHDAPRRGRLGRTLAAVVSSLALGLSLLVATSAPAAAEPATNANPAGIDVSHWQGTINWNSVRAAGIEFAWIKATEGTSYKDPQFNRNYPNAHAAGVIRGAYHFARPGASSGAVQANFFASNGGAWSADNLTLPGVLDLEAGCHGLSQPRCAPGSWTSTTPTRPAPVATSSSTRPRHGGAAAPGTGPE